MVAEEKPKNIASYGKCSVQSLTTLRCWLQAPSPRPPPPASVVFSVLVQKHFQPFIIGSNSSRVSCSYFTLSCTRPVGCSAVLIHVRNNSTALHLLRTRAASSSGFRKVDESGLTSYCHRVETIDEAAKLTLEERKAKREMNCVLVNWQQFFNFGNASIPLPESGVVKHVIVSREVA